MRQGEVRVRSLLRLVSLLAGGAVLCALAWGVRWQAAVCLALSGFFGLVLLLEYLALRRNRKKLAASDESA